VEPTQKRFLNSGGFIGYVTDLYELLTSSKVADDDDDQLFYTKQFLNVLTRVNQLLSDQTWIIQNALMVCFFEDKVQDKVGCELGDFPKLEWGDGRSGPC
jgi:hypothetical protein